MPLPFPTQGFVMKSFDQSQPGRTGDDGNILPLLVTLQDIKRCNIELFFHPTVLFYLPHAAW